LQMAGLFMADYMTANLAEAVKQCERRRRDVFRF
jgi:hypothetical protein